MQNDLFDNWLEEKPEKVADIKKLTGRAVFTDDTFSYIKSIVAQTNKAVIVSEKKHDFKNNCSFTYKEIKSNYAGFLTVAEKKIIILTDIDPLYRYDTSIARFFVNVCSSISKHKIVIGKKMIRNNIYDIFSYMFFLDKKIIDINHYWCFKANHMEESVFDKQPIRMLDIEYLAKKLKDYIILDKPVLENSLEKAIYETIST